jgi:uncharacterized protein YdhG (YjbR/CyaY superfamily)
VTALPRPSLGTTSTDEDGEQMGETDGDLTVSEGFSEAEREAMKQRAEELRAGRGGRKKAENLQAALAAIAEMPDGDRAIAERIHAIVTRVAPGLLARTWYGMPAYADGKDVVCFFQGASKFDARYATLGFNDRAQLDDGEMWPVTFAIVRWTDAVEDRVEELVRTAVG